jgi:predicted restriction endonuclease
MVPGARGVSALSQLFASEDPIAAIEAIDAAIGRELIDYLRHPGQGLFFDPSKNHDAWVQPAGLFLPGSASSHRLLQTLEASFPEMVQGDSAAEALAVDSDEVEVFRQQIEQKSYAVADSTATIKSRGSAQRAFAGAVKANYGYRCAITGVMTTDFLVASHIVPWSEDQSVRLDPSNGICLSLIVDRAFEKGYLLIEDDLTIRIDWDRMEDDKSLQSLLEPYDGRKLTAPSKGAPQPEFLQRRRALVSQAS